MNIYLLEQEINTGYDTYDSCVVVAENENDARQINPSGFVTHVKNNKWMGTYSGGTRIGDEYEIDSYSWVQYEEIDKIKVTLIGTAIEGSKRGVVCASFNAG